MRRVAITGMAPSALWAEYAEFAEACARPLRHRPHESTDRSHFRFQNGAEVRVTAISLLRHARDFMDRFAQFAVMPRASRGRRRSLVDARASRNRRHRHRVLRGGKCNRRRRLLEVYKLGHNRVHPLTIPRPWPTRAPATSPWSSASPAPVSPFPPLLIPPATPSAGLLDGALGRDRPGIAAAAEAPFSSGY